MATPPKGAVSQELTDALTDMNLAVDETAVYIDGLVNQVKQSMTPQEVADYKASMGVATARLRALRVDPNNPQPPPPPPPVFKKR